MPHCQKEKHNHAGKSKKERQKAKLDAITRKQKVNETQAAIEAEIAAKTNLSNNIATVEGHGAYEIGCEAEPEYHKFNLKKRNKKHLRNDLRKKMVREAEEEEERLKIQQEEEYRQQQYALKKAAGEDSSEEEEEEEEEPPVVLEYFIFICECCDKKYATKNQFLNHCNSQKHKSKVRIYEDLGLIVTHIELRGENGNEKDIYDDDYNKEEEVNEKQGINIEDDSNNDNNAICRQVDGETKNENDDDDDDDDDEEEESEDEDVPPKRNIFAGFAAAGFSSSSEDDSSDDDNSSDDDDHRDRSLLAARSVTLKNPPPANDDGDSDNDNIDFEKLIYQNQLIQNEIDAENKKNSNTIIAATSLPFDETYNQDDHGINEHRLASVQYRLRKNLADKGIESTSRAAESYDPLDAITLGKTLLQQVMEANIDTLQQKLDTYKKHKEQCELMTRQFALAKGNSKALPAQYIRKKDAADNARTRANVHHAGSHYHMQAARSMQFGRTKGLLARHSSQGARLQSNRMATKESNARMQQQGGVGGMKIGKTSKKSNQKKRGEAGGSKKTGGGKGGEK